MSNQEYGCQCGSNVKRDGLLDQKEVAEILGVKPKTMEYWRWKGGGPAYIKMGKLVRYRESDIKLYVAQLTA